MHKRNFSLSSGACLNDDNYSIIAFDVKVDDTTNDILVLLPEPDELDAVLGTSKWMVRRDTAEAAESGVEIVGPDGNKVAGDTAKLVDTNGCAGGCGDSKLDW